MRKRLQQHSSTWAPFVGGCQGGNSLLQGGPDPSRLSRQGRNQPGRNLRVLVEGLGSSGRQLAHRLVQEASQALGGCVQLRVRELCAAPPRSGAMHMECCCSRAWAAFQYKMGTPAGPGPGRGSFAGAGSSDPAVCGVSLHSCPELWSRTTSQPPASQKLCSCSLVTHGQAPSLACFGGVMEHVAFSATQHLASVHEGRGKNC